MSRLQLKYNQNVSLAKDIELHFRNCPSYFYEQLSNRTDITTYSKKLEMNSQRFELWDDATLIGLIAAYCNDIEKINCYITNVSVHNNYLKQGVASYLIQKCIDYAQRNAFKSVSLEVASTNYKAIALYNSFHFLQISIKKDSLIMQLNINKKNEQ